jgi:hypothetical protein
LSTFLSPLVQEMFVRINKVWATAGIDWSLKEITMIPMASEEVIISAMQGTERVTSDFLLEPAQIKDARKQAQFGEPVASP